VQNPVVVSQDVIVPEPQYTPASTLKECIARVVIPGTRMLSAVSLND